MDYTLGGEKLPKIPGTGCRRLQAMRSRDRCWTGPDPGDHLPGINFAKLHFG
jgi:hypothetical protein